jgi:hypothetical protein
VKIKAPRNMSNAAGYDARYLASKHGISRQQAREVISRIGNNRSRLNAEAEKLKKPTIKRRLRPPNRGSPSRRHSPR